MLYILDLVIIKYFGNNIIESKRIVFTYPDLVTLSCILIAKHDQVLIFISVYFYSFSLLAITKASVIFFRVCMLSAQYINIIHINQKPMSFF